MTQPNRFVALARHADGEPLSEAHFSIREGSLPTPADGQVVVRPLALSVDPYMRGRMTGVDTFYLSQFKLGEPIRSLGVGRVLESRQAGYQPGDIVQGLMDWSDCSIWAGAAQLEGGGVLQKVDPSIGKLSHVLGVLGLNGLTAIFGVLGVARPEPGQTILISGAAGGIGSVAGQIARLRGARVVGVAGSQKKCDILVNELGFDAALDYRSTKFAEDLRATLPQGPDIYFDNVGGAVSQNVMWGMRRGTRIVECGQVSTYDEAGGGWTVDIKPIHANGLRWESFTTAHFQDFVPGALAQLAHWIRSGKIRVLETEYQGLETAPRAIVGMMRGINIGKMIVSIPET